MLDENLPTFFIKPSTDNERQSTILFGQGGHDLKAEYTLRRPDPSLPQAKNCYAIALYDCYNPEVLFAEVLVQPEWSQPTLSQAEMRAQNGSPPPLVPIVPNDFVVQLYNPDQQVKIKQIAGSWNSSAHWEFEMPQQTFRLPSVSALDRSQDDPAASDTTPKIAFKWKREGKLSKDITCFLSGKSTEGKRSREPDITIAMFKHGKEMTVYEPNMARVEVEDSKGLEVVLLLSSTVIKDIFFNASREMFNIGAAGSANAPRKNSGGIPTIGRIATGVPSASGSNSVAQQASTVPSKFSAAQGHSSNQSRPPPQPPRPSQAEIDAETSRLKLQAQADEKRLQVERKDRERQDREEQKRIKKMLEQEEKERQRRDAEVAKETERLRKKYGVQPIPDSPHARVHFAPNMPARPDQATNPNSHFLPGNQPPPSQALPQFYSAPHTQAAPFQRPSSTPNAVPNAAPAPRPTSGFFGKWLGPVASQPVAPAPGPYLQAPTDASASSSGFFGGGDRARDERRRLLGLPVDGEGGRKKVAKKRSVYF